MTKRHFLRWVLLLLLILLATGCRRGNESGGDLSIDLEARPDPPLVGDATLLVTLTDGDGNPIEDATLRVKGDMSHPGMTPVLAEAGAGPGGVYEIPFRWTMAGDWFVTVDVTLPDGTTASQRYDFTVAGDGLGR